MFPIYNFHSRLSTQHTVLPGIKFTKSTKRKIIFLEKGRATEMNEVLVRLATRGWGQRACEVGDAGGMDS